MKMMIGKWPMAHSPTSEGRQPLNISHEGGEFEALETSIPGMRKE